MNRYDKIALKIASDNSLDGMLNQKAKNEVNKVLARNTPSGILRDNDWRHVQRIWDALTAASINWTMTKSEYTKDERGVPTSKTWQFEIQFMNNKGRPTTLYGVVVASGAGTMEDPLSAYDLVAYVS